ncbi:MAG: hypothetical protein PHG17_05980, partial [Bacteroides sp.]|nr:hypothetical protein [Bacteroides sp.]
DNTEWSTVEIKVLSLNDKSGELVWHWGNLTEDVHPSWKSFSSLFKVLKEGELEDYILEGFDHRYIIE